MRKRLRSGRSLDLTFNEFMPGEQQPEAVGACRHLQRALQANALAPQLKSPPKHRDQAAPRFHPGATPEKKEKKTRRLVHWEENFAFANRIQEGKERVSLSYLELEAAQKGVAEMI